VVDLVDDHHSEEDSLVDEEVEVEVEGVGKIFYCNCPKKS
jgi:hypothetical protein